MRILFIICGLALVLATEASTAMAGEDGVVVSTALDFCEEPPPVAYCETPPPLVDACEAPPPMCAATDAVEYRTVAVKKRAYTSEEYVANELRVEYTEENRTRLVERTITVPAQIIVPKAAIRKVSPPGSGRAPRLARGQYLLQKDITKKEKALFEEEYVARVRHENVVPVVKTRQVPVDYIEYEERPIRKSR